MSKPIALITGASSGIGRATARTFLDGGYTTIVTARRVEALQETLDGHANGFAIPADMTKPMKSRPCLHRSKRTTAAWMLHLTMRVPVSLASLSKS